MSGNLTPLSRDAAASGDVPRLPAAPMPAFHRRKEVQLMLGKWRNGASLWGRILSGSARGPWDGSQRFIQHQHTMIIR